MTRVYLIRHAQAEGNIKQRFHGIYDADISEAGLIQLEALKERCSTMDFDVAYASPLQRSIKTAKAAIGDRDIPLNIDSSIIELNIGEMEDIPFDDFPTKYPEEYRIWQQEPHLFNPPGGEKMADMRNRIVSGFLNIVKSNKDKSILVVSHGCAMRSLICTLKNEEYTNLKSIEWCDNTAIYTIDFDDDFNAHFVSYRDASHLPLNTKIHPSKSWWRVVIPKSHSRILGVDFGDTRTGLALSDEGFTLASPIGTIVERNFDKVVDSVVETALKNNCCEIVLGYPLNMNGTKGPRAEKAELFAHLVETKSDVSVYLWDERLTTVGAAVYMNTTDFKGKKRKDNIDTASACLILQGYLDKRKNN